MSTQPCQPAKKTLKTIRRCSIILFYFFFDFLVDMVDKEEKCLKYQTFSCQLKRQPNCQPGAFSEWKLHLPGFFLCDFPKTILVCWGLVDTLPAFL